MLCSVIRKGGGNHGELVIVQQSDDGNDRAPQVCLSPPKKDLAV